MLTEASFLAAGGDVLRFRHGFKFSQPTAPSPPKELSAGDKARVFAQLPTAWTQAQRQFGWPKIDEVLAARDAEDCDQMARARIDFW